MHVYGVPLVFFMVPFLIGTAICVIAGICAALYIFAWFTDLIIDRLVRMFNLYDAVLATGIQRIKARRQRRAEKTK